MDKALTSLVLLKYDILTPDKNTWHLCETYPTEVRTNWAWRCVADVEYLAKGHPESEMCIEMAKRYSDGFATRRALDTAHTVSRDSGITSAAHVVVSAAYFAAITSIYANAWHLTVRTAYYAVCAGAAKEQSRKWDLYISWLVEELGAWEQALTSRDAMVDH